MMEYLKVVGGCATAFGLICSVALFAIRALIRQNNDRLLDRFNGRYLKRELYEERDKALNEKLDLIHKFQKEKMDFERDRFDEVADLCQSVNRQQEGQNVRLTVLEARFEDDRGQS